MLPGLVFYKLLLVTLVCLCFMLHVLWPAARTAVRPSPPTATPPRRKRSKDPRPLTGLIHKPLCEACEHATDARPKAPGTPPPQITYTRGRKRTIDTQQHFCPDRDCTYFGWLGRGNLRANGHPGGKAWDGVSLDKMSLANSRWQPSKEQRCSSDRRLLYDGARVWYRSPLSHIPRQEVSDVSARCAL